MFKIFYDGQDVFSGISPTPFVEIGESSIYGSRKNGIIQTINLNGTILSDPCLEENEFSFLYGKANDLIDRFSSSFKSISIEEHFPSGSSVLYSGDSAILRSIDFPESRFVGILPYTINLDIYSNESWLGVGINSPTQEIKFQDNQDGSITISKKTSAIGYNASGQSALDNAINFVQSVTGWNQNMSPAFADNTGESEAILLSLNEEIDRLSATYTVNESWIYDNEGNITENSFYKLTKSIESGQGGVSVTLEGSLTGKHMANWENLRQDFNLIDFFGVAESFYTDSGFGGNLSSQAFSKSITENVNEKNINFSFNYRDSVTEDPYIVDQFNVSWQKEDNKNCINAQIEIKSLDPCLSNRWQKVKDFYEDFDLYAWIASHWEEYRFYFLADGGDEEKGYWKTDDNFWTTNSNKWSTSFGKLSNFIQSKKVSFNQKNGSITISASICDKKVVVPEHFNDLSYNVQINPSMPSYIPFQGVNDGGNFTIQKLIGLKRKIVSIQGNGIILSCSTREQAEISLKSYINNIKLNYLAGNDCFLLSSNIKYSSSDSTRVSFTFEWSEDGELIFDQSLLNS